MHNIENESPIDFITSDNPVCLHNQYLDNLQNCTGIKEVFSSKGLIILCPITYKKLLLLYDPSVYEIEDWEPVIKVDNASDIEKINICQCLSANEVIFYSNSIDFNGLKNWSKEVRSQYQMKYGIFKSTRNNNARQTPYNWDISLIKLHQKNNILLNQRKLEIRNKDLLEFADNHHRRLSGGNNILFEILATLKNEIY